MNLNTTVTLTRKAAIARKPRDAAAVCFGLMFTEIHHKYSQALKALTEL